MGPPTTTNQRPHMATTVKKEQGCFQCSRRRIVCDRNEPCLKCIKKGIECSGLGRIRFAEGVARRGRLKDCKIPVAEGVQEGGIVLPTRGPSQALTWPEDRKSAKRKRREDNKIDVIPWQQNIAILSHVPVADELNEAAVGDIASQALTVQPGTWGEEDEDIEEVVQSNLVQHTRRRSGLQRWLPPVSSTTRMLFSYFGEAVAPAMVLLDDYDNGYRSFVLPMALEDDTVRRAVSVVAAQHLSIKRPELKPVAEAGRTAIISRLYRNSLGKSPDQVFNQFTWTTLIVLLVGETVTGSADFRFLVQMLMSLATTNSAYENENSNLVQFLRAQTDLFELLGVPQLGEEVGILTIMKASDLLTRFLWVPHLPEDSEDRILADRTRQCFISACDIYIRRATNPTPDATTDLLQKHAIERLIGLLHEIPTTFRGSHALVWTCFIAGADTTDEAQRAFLISRMWSTYERTGFRNIPLSIKSLENIWSRKTDKRWTLCLPELSNVLVM